MGKTWCIFDEFLCGKLGRLSGRFRNTTTFPNREWYRHGGLNARRNTGVLALIFRKKYLGEALHILSRRIPAGLFFTFGRKDWRGIQGPLDLVHEIHQQFFGSTVTVAGLLTAQDIAGQLGNLQGDYFFDSQG
jgi:hypothetical protein